VDLPLLLVVGDVQRLERPVAADPGVVDEDVDLGEVLVGGVEDPLRGARVGDVRGERHRAAVALGRRLVQAVERPRDEQDARTLLGESPGDRPADAAARTGDDGTVIR
jgi:hypothetical protein